MASRIRPILPKNGIKDVSSHKTKDTGRKCILPFAVGIRVQTNRSVLPFSATATTAEVVLKKRCSFLDFLHTKKPIYSLNCCLTTSFCRPTAISRFDPDWTALPRRGN